MRLYKKNNKIFIRFLLSYVLVIGIILLVVNFAYYITIKAVEDNTIRQNLSILEYNSDIVDQQLREIENLVLQISLKPSVMRMINMGKIKEGSPDLFKSWALYEEMKPYRLANSFITELYVYFDESETIVTPQYFHTSLSRYYGVFFQYDGMSLEQWRQEYLNVLHINHYIPARKVCFAKTDMRVITYINTLPLSLPQINKGAIIALINEEKLGESLRPLREGSKGWVYIRDADGNIMASFGNYPGDEYAVDLDGMQGARTMTVAGTKMMVSYTTSGANGWQYISVMPIEEIMAEVQAVKVMVYFINMLALAVGVLMAVYLTYRNFKPVKSLVRMVSGMVGEAQQGNEFEYLGIALKRLSCSNSELQDRLKAQASQLSGNFIDRLLKGGFNTQGEIDEMKSHSRLDIGGNFYCVVLLHINGMKEGLADNKLDEYSLTRIILKNEFRPYIRYDCQVYDISESEITLLLFTDHKVQQEFQEYLADMVRDTKRNLTEQYGIDVVYAVGSTVADIQQVHQSFVDARQAFDFYLYKDGGPVNWYSDILPGQGSYYYPLHLESRLIGMCKAGSVQGLSKVMNDLYRENFINRELPIRMLQLLVHNICATQVKLLDQVHIAHTPCMPDESLESLGDLDQAFMDLSDSFQKICIKLSEQRNDKSSTLKVDMLDFIEKNYMNSSLRLAELAGMRGYSESRLYHVFQEMTGSTFSDYLEMVRMKYAVRLLLNSSLSIKEVAEMTGYNNDHSFRRAFKRNHGIGPTEYRAINPVVDRS